MARRVRGSSQTSRIGTSGQVLTCQRALVNTVQAVADGTDNPLTSTIRCIGENVNTHTFPPAPTFAITAFGMS